MKNLKWRPSKEGYTETSDGRFRIVPLFMGRETVQGYQVRDTLKNKTWSGDTQRDLKSDCEDVLRRERSS